MSARIFGRSQAVATSALVFILAIPAPSGTAATGRASANIIQAIAVTEIAPMSFAAVAPPAGGGTVILTPSGTISSASGFIFHGKPSPAAFHARGTANYPASVSLSTANIVTGPGPAMQLSAFTGKVAPSFDGAANLNFSVGAALTINPNQTPGKYSGTYAVTVNY